MSEKKRKDIQRNAAKYKEVQIKVNKDINLKIESLLTHTTILSGGSNTIQHASINPIVTDTSTTELTLLVISLVIYYVQSNKSMYTFLSVNQQHRDNRQYPYTDCLPVPTSELFRAFLIHICLIITTHTTDFTLLLFHLQASKNAYDYIISTVIYTTFSLFVYVHC